MLLDNGVFPPCSARLELLRELNVAQTPVIVDELREGHQLLESGASACVCVVFSLPVHILNFFLQEGFRQDSEDMLEQGFNTIPEFQVPRFHMLQRFSEVMNYLIHIPTTLSDDSVHREHEGSWNTPY